LVKKVVNTCGRVVNSDYKSVNPNVHFCAQLEKFDLFAGNFCEKNVDIVEIWQRRKDKFNSEDAVLSNFNKRISRFEYIIIILP